MSLKYDTLAGKALADLKKQGIALPAKPAYEIPTLPTELTALGDEALMELYSKLTAYADFIAVQVSCAIIDERQAEKKLGHREQALMLGHSLSKSESRVTFARAQVANDGEVLAMKDELDQVYAYRKLIESLAANIERDTFLVSRELTRRTSGIASRRTGWNP